MAGSLPDPFPGALQLFQVLSALLRPTGLPTVLASGIILLQGAPAPLVWTTVVLTLIPINSLGNPGCLIVPVDLAIS